MILKNLQHLGGRYWKCMSCGDSVTADCPCCEPKSCNCDKPSIIRYEDHIVTRNTYSPKENFRFRSDRAGIECMPLRTLLNERNVWAGLDHHYPSARWSGWISAQTAFENNDLAFEMRVHDTGLTMRFSGISPARPLSPKVTDSLPLANGRLRDVFPNWYSAVSDAIHLSSQPQGPDVSIHACCRGYTLACCELGRWSRGKLVLQSHHTLTVVQAYTFAPKRHADTGPGNNPPYASIDLASAALDQEISMSGLVPDEWGVYAVDVPARFVRHSLRSLGFDEESPTDPGFPSLPLTSLPS